MRLACSLTPDRDVVDHAILAEDLGYDRVWIADTPAIYADVWMVLTRIAEGTATIGLGPAVVVPSLRHVMVTATATATLEAIAPGRVAVAIGRGFTGRELLGKPPMRLAEVETYVRQLRALLAGEKVLVDGALTQMLHREEMGVANAAHVPVLIASNGPKGAALARQVADGVFSVVTPQSGFDWASVSVSGAVLADGEPIDSARVRAAAGPAVVVRYHYAATFDPQGLAAMPGGSKWLAKYDAIPDSERHLRMHEDHYLEPSDLDRVLVTSDTLAQTFTGTKEELRARLIALEGQGATDVVYHPTGDVPRELTAFASMALQA